MSQSRWVSLERYDLKAGFRVLGGNLFPVIEGGEDALRSARSALEELGFQRLAEGGYAIGWRSLPTAESWSQAFPAATFESLERLAHQAALDDEARSQMVQRGMVSEAAFAAPEEPQGVQGTPEPAPDPEPASEPEAEAAWDWLNMDAYGLDVVIRKMNQQSLVRVEGSRAAKHLVKESMARAGAEVEEGGDDLDITIPLSGGFDMSRMRSELPLATISRVPVKAIEVRGAGDLEGDSLDLMERVDRLAIASAIKERYEQDGERFTQEGLREMTADSLGVSPTLMRPEFGINPRMLQELLESGLTEIFSTEAPTHPDPSSLIRSGARIDGMLPAEKAGTNQSRQLQQFSTPLAISGAVQSILGLDDQKSVWEPTAGNGSLVALAAPGNVHGLELDPQRVENLHTRGMVGVRQGDAVSSSLDDAKYPRVVMNPPFGAFGDGQGPRVFKSDVHGPNGGTPPFIKTPSQDKYIALRHLDKLEKDGVAAMILGADHPMNHKPGEYSDQTERFLSFVGDTYNILSLAHVEGSLYGSHGAGWPLLMVVTGDKRDELGDYYPPETLPVISTISDLERFVEQARDQVLAYEQDRDVGAPEPEQDGQRDHENSGMALDSAGDGEGQAPGAANGGDNVPPAEEDDAAADEPEYNDSTEDAEPENGEEPSSVDDTRQRHAADAEEKEVRYSARSSMPSLDKRVPANLASPIENALDRVERANGDVDLFVSKAMGWSMDQLENSLAAEQVDAVALALYQAQQGKGFILGDNTGIGKGRVVAAIAAWGIKNGHKPIFCTSKSDLFGDIMRDFEDIGESSIINPLILNNLDKDIIKEETGESIVKKTPRKDVSKAINDGGIPDQYNAVFMTYSQVNRDIAKSKKAQWLQKAADNNVLLFDEVHNASGPDSNTGANVRDAIRQATFTMGASATYAKRPDNLGLYEFTSMFEGNDPESVIESVIRGGPEYQEVLSTMLAESGQLIARAHEAPPPPQAVTVNPSYEEGFDSLEFSDRLARVLDAMTAVAEEGEKIVNAENERIRDIIKGLPKDQQKGLSGWKSQSVHFASQMHHIVRVANYAAKADAIVGEIEDAVSEGRRPLVAVEGTMEAFLRSSYQEEIASREKLREIESERTGVALEDVPLDTSPVSSDLTYRDTLQSFLNSMLVIQRTDKYGNESEEPIVDVSDYLDLYYKEKNGENDPGDPTVFDKISLDKARESIDESQATTLDYYFQVLGLVHELPESLPASPIDYVRSRVEASGIKMGELTGRKMGLDYNTSDGMPQFYIRDDQDRNRRLQADQFNNGDVQCLLFNSAAAEGVSLHAHKDFKNNEDRRTLFWQVPGDINVYTQMSGRTHRSGAREGALPDFRVVCLDTPTEDRMMANLEQKEGSLKANVKADRETGIAMRSEPMMNRVGDFVTWEVLNSHPQSEDISKRLGVKLDSELEKFSQSGIKDKTGSDTGLFSKITGRLCRMELSESRPLLETMEEAFRARVENLDQQGTNPLKTQIHDLNATLLEKRELFPRSGPSAFESEVVAQQVGYTDYIEPIMLESIRSQLGKSRDMLEKRGFGDYPIKDMESHVAHHHEKTLMLMLENQAPDFWASLSGGVDEKILAAKTAIKNQPSQVTGDDSIKENLQAIVSHQDDFNRLSDLIGLGVEVKNVPVGGMLLDCDVEKSDMTISRIVPPFNGENPSLPGKWSIRLESPDAEVGKFNLSMNQLMNISRANPDMLIDNEALEPGELESRFHQDRHPQTLQRERWVVMGNLPKGYSMTANADGALGRGKPGVFTSDDGRKLRGIIMPKDFDTSDLRRLMSSSFSMSTLEAISAYVDKKNEESYHPVIYTTSAKQMQNWATKENKEFHPGRGAVLLKDQDTNEWKMQVSYVKKNNANMMKDGYLLNMLDGDFSRVGGSKTMEAIVPSSRLDDVVARIVREHGQTIHGDGADADWYRGFMRQRGERLIQEQKEAEQKNMEADSPENIEQQSVQMLQEPAPQNWNLNVGLG